MGMNILNFLLVKLLLSHQDGIYLLPPPAPPKFSTQSHLFNKVNFRHICTVPYVTIILYGGP